MILDLSSKFYNFSLINYYVSFIYTKCVTSAVCAIFLWFIHMLNGRLGFLVPKVENKSLYVKKRVEANKFAGIPNKKSYSIIWRTNNGVEDDGKEAVSVRWYIQ